MTRTANPNRIRYEVVLLEPPVAGQYETTVEQSGVWREQDHWVVERQTAFGRAIAEILGYGSFLGRAIATREDVERGIRDVEAGEKLFYVPHTTLCDAATVAKLRIDATNFYGGSVTYPHEGTKLIMRKLLHPHSPRPEGWNETFADAVASLEIPGYAVFSVEDLTDATKEILERHGAARIKLATGAGAEGQYVVDCASELPPIVERILESYPIKLGACVEVDLIDPLLYFVNTETIGAFRLSSLGRYRRGMTTRGAEAGVGTDDEVVVGDIGALDVSLSILRRHPDIPQVLDLARRFDFCVRKHLSDVLLTRNLYQFIVGCDARGKKHIGTLEQSWRRGGNSAGTLLAAREFLADETLTQVSCCNENAFAGNVEPSHWVLANHHGLPDVSWITRRHYARQAT